MGGRTTVRPGTGSDRWFEIKSKIHHKLLSSLNPEQLRTLNKESVRAQIGGVVERLVADEGIPMTLAERERVIEEILDEVFGLGPLEPLLKDPTISDILVNGFDNVYVERAGRMVETNIRFKDASHVRLIIERIVSAIVNLHNEVGDIFARHSAIAIGHLELHALILHVGAHLWMAFEHAGKLGFPIAVEHHVVDVASLRRSLPCVLAGVETDVPG